MPRINLPLDYVHCTYFSFCFLLIPLGKGKWLALRQSTRKLRPVAYDEVNNPITHKWQLVVTWDICNQTAKKQASGCYRFRQVWESLFGDPWYRYAKIQNRMKDDE